MRKIFATAMLSVVCLYPASGLAQDTMDDNHYRYKVDYIEEQALLRNNHSLTLAKFNLEWPVCLCYSSQPVLQSFLCHEIFAVKEKSLSKGMEHYFRSKGKRITQIPEDTSLTVTYYTCLLKILGWEEGRYISFNIHTTSRENKEQEDVVYNGVYTYDIIQQKILRVKDIISPKYNVPRMPLYYNAGLSLVTNYHDRYIRETSLFLYDDLEEKKCTACVIPYGVVISIDDENFDSELPVLHAIPLDYVRKGLAKPTKRMLERQVSVSKDTSSTTKPVVIALDPNVAADTTVIYDVVENPPVFQKGIASMLQYFKDETKYPEFEMLTKKDGKVVITFVVNRDGRVCSPSIIKPCSPGIDREAVRAVMAMSKWTPGTHNGVAVNTRITQSLQFSLKQSDN